ncbi:MAG: DUF4097 domain-containing protein [Fimbriimonadales bacterium]|nr:DUF4097 domain-containing protein [Fimbriimonadales bacterium]
MREEILRILRLVEQGRIKPEEAAELIDALTAAEHGASDEAAEAQRERPEEEARRLFERITHAAEEAVRGINWRAIVDTIRTQTQRGLEEMRKALEELEREGWGIPRRHRHEASTKHTLNFAIQPGQTLEIRLPAGDLILTGGFDGGRVEAEVRLRGASPDALQEKLREWSLLIEQTDTGARITAPELNADISQTVDLTLQLPRQINLLVQTERGDIRVEKLDGELRLHTKHGDLSLHHITGVVEAKVAHGDIYLEHFKGARVQFDTQNGDLYLHDAEAEQVRLHATRGDVSIERLNTQRLSVETVSGDIEAELLQPLTGEARLTAVSGDIELRLPDGGDCQVSLRTVSGDIECDLTCREVSRERNSFWGICGEGKGTLSVEAVSGDVAVRLRAHETF